MMGGNFAGVGGGKLHITDLKFTGYDQGTWYTTHTLSGLALNKLAANGSTEMTYTWKDSYNKTEQKFNGGYWTWRDADGNTGDVVKDGPYDAEIDVGNGYWCAIAAKQNNTDIYLTCAGQVLFQSQAVPSANATSTRTNKKVLCNPMAVPCKISKVSFAGYDEGNWYTSHTLSGLVLNKVAANGSTEIAYTWKDSYNKQAQKFNGGYWTWRDADGNTGDLVEGSDQDITIDPGDGFWAAIAARQNNTDIYLVWPKTDIGE